MKWKLTIINWNDINAGKYNGDVFLNSKVEGLFFTLKDCWEYLGFKLKRERAGYAGMKGGLEYIVERWVCL